MVPYLEGEVDGQLKSTLPTGSIVTLPEQEHKYWGLRLVLEHVFKGVNISNIIKLVICLFLFEKCFSAEAVTISVIVPCEKSHIEFLPDLLNALKMQSHLPDEVVISVSRVTKKDSAQISRAVPLKFLH